MLFRRGSEMVQPDFNIFFFRGGGGGGVLKVVNTCIYQLSFILKLDMAKSIFLNIFVQDCRSKFQGELKHKSVWLL